MSQVIQIIPIQNYYVIYKDKDGKEFKSHLPIIALYDNGDIEPLDMDNYGFWEKVCEASNFVRIECSLDEKWRAIK